MSQSTDDLIARLAVERGLVSQADVERARREIASAPGGARDNRLGTLLVRMGLVTSADLAALLAATEEAAGLAPEQRDAGRRAGAMGAILVARGYLADEDLERCLARQRRDREEGITRPLGYYLVDESLVSVHHIQEALTGQHKEVLVCGYCHAAYNVRGYDPGKRFICPRCLTALRVPDSGEMPLADLAPGELALEPRAGGLEAVWRRDQPPPVPAGPPPAPGAGGARREGAKGENGGQGAAAAAGGSEAAATRAWARPDGPEPPPLPGGVAGETDADAALGLVIGGCELIQKVGEGGMGAVYRARHALLDKVVAVKLLRKDLLKDPASVRRFYNEARAAARMEHENIVPVYNVGWEHGYHFFTMQFVEGQDVAAVIEARGAYQPAEALRVMLAVCRALTYAHERGLVHRDIKPENIIITPGGGVKVADFGLVKNIFDREAKITGEGQIVGSPHYMAPEVINEEEIDERCDLYSLGAALYHMLAGRRPFDGASTFAILMKHLNEEPVPLRALAAGVTPEVEALVARLMAKKVADRFPSAEAAREEVERVLAPEFAGAGVTAGRAGPPPLPDEEGAEPPDPGRRDAVLKARALLEAANPSGALAALLAAWKERPGSDELTTLIFQAENEANRAKQIRQYQASIKLFIDARSFDKAFEAIEEGLKVAPDDRDLLKYRGDVSALRAIDRKKNLLSAIDAAMKEEDLDALLAACDELLLLDGALESVRRLRDTARDRRDATRRLLARGDDLLAREDYAGALTTFREAHRLLPKDRAIVERIVAVNRARPADG